MNERSSAERSIDGQPVDGESGSPEAPQPAEIDASAAPSRSVIRLEDASATDACPSCDEPVLAVSIRGPGEHYVLPCGCRVYLDPTG